VTHCIGEQHVVGLGQGTLELRPGARVDRFRVLRPLGHGGMGVVLAAYDPDLQRQVALKLVRNTVADEPAVSSVIPDLLAEARVMAGLDHPNIVKVHEVGRFRDNAYLVMELVDGATMGEWLRHMPERPWQSIVEAFAQAGRALAYAHDRGVAHGDFKPENLLVDARDRVRVTDFGLSCPLPAAPSDPDGPGDLSGHARATMVMGTPRYMAPEQYLGWSPAARSDQFSFCVALFEALYGRHPCTHDSSRSLVELPLAEARNPRPEDTQVPDWLAYALARGLSADPAARYDSMYALLADLVAPVRRSRGRARSTAVLMSVLAAFVFGLHAVI
jgi:serine/threonine protein kinase